MGERSLQTLISSAQGALHNSRFGSVAIIKTTKSPTTEVKISTLNNLVIQVKEAKNIIKQWNAAKRILFQRPKVTFSTTTQYKVCGRQFTKEEETKRNELKVLIDRSNKATFIKNKQQCPVATFRKKRDLQDVQNQFSSIPGTQVIELFCNERRAVQNNTLSMCNECAYRIIFPPSYFPRYHFHYTCDENGDHSCFYGEGTCVKNVETKTLKHDLNEVGFENLYQWADRAVAFTGSCSCQIIQNSLFDPFV
ncbi:uncharacterized protein LOC130646344 [Hydractinia symbiolongicarpus]|uniref:uncharacterized protein LOC130646344 n=1 Tax=Hydractinia symbiolongicarpus TaxID=13093 RepID=UPI00254BA965|nr:uncharacterized protein LOC130646344 [Hydractinia symbiolongicarpus]